jgi:3-methyl-2-oxobutanoate hydroxymethyltransferase
MPQSIKKMGGYKVQCRDEESQKKLLEDSLLLQKTGVSMIVFEGIPEMIAKTVTGKFDIPTIGIGAGRYCDGQVLVSDDLLGMFTDFTPKFVKKYANLAQVIQDATKQYSKEVKEGIFPQEVNTYK